MELNKESNYPDGFRHGVSIEGVPLVMTYPNNVYWVVNAGSNGNKGTKQQPYQTIDYAIGRCTAGAGDLIIGKEGHTETISAAAGISLDVAGVKII